MTKTRKRFRWLTIFALIAVTGCVGFESAQPLSDPETAKPDQRLVGDWKSKEAGDVVYRISVAGAAFPAGIHKLEIVDGAKTDVGYFFVSKFDNDRYVNLINFDDAQPTPEKWEGSKVNSYNLFGYRVVDNQWQIIPLQDKFVKRSIDQKLIKGEIIEDELFDDGLFDDPEDNELDQSDNLDEIDMRLTASTSELQDFFKQRRDDILSQGFEPLERQSRTDSQPVLEVVPK